MAKHSNSFLSRPLQFLTLSWMVPLVKDARNTDQLEDLFDLPYSQKASFLAPLAESYLEEPESLWMFLIKCLWPLISATFLAEAVKSAVLLYTPQLLQQVLRYIKGTREDLLVDNPWVLVLFLFIGQLTTIFMTSCISQLNIILKLKVTTTLKELVYRKALMLPPQAFSKYGHGKIVQIIQSDVTSISDLFPTIISAIFALLNLGLTGVFLFGLLKHATWPGIIAFLVFISLGMTIMTSISAARSSILSSGDTRVSMIREMLQSISYIKQCALEGFFSKRISDSRAEQLGHIRDYYFRNVVFDCTFFFSRVFTPLASFVTYALAYGDLNVEIIYPALSYFQVFESCVMALPNYYQSYLNSVISYGRLTSLVNDEFEDTREFYGPASDKVLSLRGTFSWDDSPDSFKLKDVDVTLQKKGLTIVVGKVGAGKSALLAAVLGNMNGGSVSTTRELVYCSQNPLIISGTVKSNILFGAAYDSERFNRAVAAAGLVKDITAFTNGIESVVGEKGHTLSGGQKARVSLARALYQKASLILLDDVFAALDAEVGAFIFKHAVCGEWKEHSVVMVTHHLHLVPNADHVIVMDDGNIIEQGSYHDLMQIETGHLFGLMEKVVIADEEVQVLPLVIPTDAQLNPSKIDESPELRLKELFADEDIQEGHVQATVYKQFLEMTGGVKTVFILSFATLFYEASDILTQLWLAFFAEDRLNLTTAEYLNTYVGLTASLAVATSILVAAVYYCCFNSLSLLHAKAVAGVISSPMTFFESQPVGRILSRFSGDIETMDMYVYSDLINVWMDSLVLVTTLATIVYAVVSSTVKAIMGPVLLVVVLILGWSYVKIFNFYNPVKLIFKRLMAVRRSPLVSHITESLEGISTIKAFRREGFFTSGLCKVQDEFNVIFVLSLILNAALSVWIGLTSSLLTLMVLVLAVNLPSSNAAVFGLALTYVLQLAPVIQNVMTRVALAEADFNSAERILHYANELKPEEDQDFEAAGDWPVKGELSFENVGFIYPTQPDVKALDKVSFNIQKGENIGIVGSSGSGKSTVVSALFQMYRHSAGLITLDGKDVSTVSLQALRSGIAIIPQEAHLFKGTFRSNLELQDSFTDAELWEALEKAGLKSYVSKLPQQLDTDVDFEGQSISSGQRQLLMLARIMLRNKPVLVLDEASASIDLEADQVVQASLRKQFASSTIICVAHRLDTIVDFDRVIVMEKGEVVEIGTPSQLLADSSSRLSVLADATGEGNAAGLRSIANRTETQKA